jgi:hypothetical protein
MRRISLNRPAFSAFCVSLFLAPRHRCDDARIFWPFFLLLRIRSRRKGTESRSDCFCQPHSLTNPNRFVLFDKLPSSSWLQSSLKTVNYSGECQRSAKIKIFTRLREWEEGGNEKRATAMYANRVQRRTKKLLENYAPKSLLERRKIQLILSIVVIAHDEISMSTKERFAGTSSWKIGSV